MAKNQVIELGGRTWKIVGWSETEGYMTALLKETRPIQEVEASKVLGWGVELVGNGRGIDSERTIQITLNPVTNAQAKAIREAVEALMEYLTMPDGDGPNYYFFMNTIAKDTHQLLKETTNDS